MISNPAANQIKKRNLHKNTKTFPKKTKPNKSPKRKGVLPNSVLLASSQQRCALRLKKDYMTDENLAIFVKH
jgi:hypothetical protein